MKLKKLKMQGFKSFADKTEIKFEDGITGVVGPNGSGKSNISDGIRWVLGEQSIKNLRGSKMEDVIFSGSSKRKALGLCEVSMVFDNSEESLDIEYEEVEITRRVYRSGESEYLINRSPCRLKDVRELFFDTGIGRDGYSIIGQGKIEEILSSKLEDRRNIFEEAAGIVKYRQKKLDSKRKLERTKENLLRLEDILSELIKHCQRLEKEAKKAEAYLLIYEDLKKLDINYSLERIESTSKKLKEEEDKRLALEKVLLEKEAIRKTLEELVLLTRKDLEDLEVRLEEKLRLIEEENSHRDSLINKVNLKEEQIKFLTKDQERIKRENKEQNFRLDNIRSKKLQLEKDLIRLESEYEDLDKVYKVSMVDLEAIDNEINKINKEIEPMELETLRLEKDKIHKISKIENLDLLMKNLEERLTGLEGEARGNLDLLNKDLAKDEALNTDLIGTRESLKTLISLESNLEDEINNLILIKDRLEKDFQEINNQLQRVESKYSIFLSMEENYEGYYKGVREILSHRDLDQDLRNGIIGPVGDLFTVVNAYERAIEVALGSSIQNIVVKDESCGKYAIEYLKENKLGKITCLPLNIIKGTEISLRLNREELGILGLGHELISFKKDYDEIFKYLLARTIICKDLNYGLEVFKRTNYRYKIVTLDGQTLNPGGSMTGGSHYNSQAKIINRSREVKELKLEIEKLRQLTDFKSLELEKAQDTISLKSQELKDIKNKIDLVRHKILEINSNLDKANYYKSSITTRLDNINLEKEDISSKLESYKKELNILKENLETDEENLITNKNILEKSSFRLSGLKSLRENKNQDYIENKIKINNLNSRVSESVNTIKSLEEDIQGSLYLISENNLRGQEIEKAIFEAENEIKISKKEIEDSRFKLSKDQDLKEEIERDRLKLRNKYYETEDKLREIGRKIEKLSLDISNKKSEEDNYSRSIRDFINKLEEDYGLSHDLAKEYARKNPINQVDLTKLKLLKSKIKAMGNINEGAIEEHREEKERLDFILKQKSDLLKSKKDLEEIIKNIEVTMEEQFLKSFKAIDKNFSEIFRNLFNGGEARLSLEDDKNILESGIEIYAQPPGKKLQNLNLLSGGERSLTAVALLFSILKLKPAPFCVLDEIDAALDEGNIGRYKNYLKEFNKETQFIIITHRKSTMEIADVLYGITMEEEGVSNVVSLELKDL